MTQTQVNLSFLRLFNHIKGINKPYSDDEIDPMWLEERADKASRERWTNYLQHYEKVGVAHPKVKYPVMFGQGDNMYPGMMATEDIKKGEQICKIPAREIITTRAAFFSEPLMPIYYENPELFGRHVHEGEDMVLHTFILHEIQKKEASRYFYMIKNWPRDTDILMNWDEEDLEYLQDPTLMSEAEKSYNELMDTWNRLYEVLRNYPEVFKPESISFSRFKWVTILTTNRCFASNWPGVCQMVPFADQVNHENVDVNYDCLDQETGESLLTKAEKELMRKKEEEDKKQKRTNFLLDLKDDLVDMSDEIQKNYVQTLAEEGQTLPSDKNTWRIQVKGREKPKLVNKPTFAEDN